MMRWAVGLVAGLVLGALSVGLAQDLPSQPDLDLPVHVQNYLPGAPGVIPPDEPPDDPRDEPPPVFFGEEIESESDTIIYVIDTSGSMRRGQSPDRIERAITETVKSIRGLPSSFRFNVISYSCTIPKLWPSLRRADEANKAEAIAYVEGLYAHSGTATGPAVASALSDREVQSVVLLTDGAPNCGAVGVSGHRSMIQNANVQRAVINVFGIDASGDYRKFCMDVAGDSGGSYFDVP